MIRTAKAKKHLQRDMDMPKIIVDSVEMRRLADKLERLAEEYQHLYEYDLYGTVVDSIRRAYKGIDADAMIHGLEEFRNDFARLKAVIDQYVAHLRYAARAYDEIQAEIETKAKELKQDVQ